MVWRITRVKRHGRPEWRAARHHHNSRVTAGRLHDRHDRNRRYMLKAITSALLGVLIALGGALTASADDDRPHRFGGPSRTICVESQMGANWTSDNAAFAELDDAVWYWDIELREGAGACDDEDQTVKLVRAHDDKKPRAWTQKAMLSRTDDDGDDFWEITQSTVYLNIDYPSGRTWRQNKLTWMHEGLHAMARQFGAPWDSHGHTGRCDSLMSTSYVCRSNYTDTGPSQWDLAWIDEVYHEWHEVSFFTPPNRFTAK